MVLAICTFAYAESNQESIALVSTASMPGEYSVVLAAVADAVISAGYDPYRFRVKIECDDKICIVDVFPEELETEKYKNFMGCPLKLCATMRYSKISGTMVEIMHWR